MDKLASILNPDMGKPVLAWSKTLNKKLEKKSITNTTTLTKIFRKTQENPPPKNDLSKVDRCDVIQSKGTSQKVEDKRENQCRRKKGVISKGIKWQRRETKK